MVNHQQEYARYCKNVQKAFEQYQKCGMPSKLPDLEIEWKNYSCLFDFDSFLKPVIDECKILIKYIPSSAFPHKDYRSLLSSETIKTIGSALDRFFWHLKHISDDNQDFNLQIILNWLKFHTARLNGLGINKTDLETLNEWLRICYDLENRESEYYFTFYQLNRDQEMRYLVFNEEGQVREFFNSEIAPGRLYIPKLINWFLYHYDLAAAAALVDLSATGQSKPDVVIKAGLGQRFPRGFWIFSSISIIIFGFLFVFAGEYLPEYQPSWISYLSTCTFSFPITGATLSDNPPANLQIRFAFPYLLIIFSLLLICIIIFSKYLIVAIQQGKSIFDFFLDNSQLLLPRLFASILVGYIPLITAGDPWKWLLRIPIVPASLIFVIMLFGALAYLFFEASKTHTSSRNDYFARRELRNRVLYVFFIGFLESLLIGIVLNELFSVGIFSTLQDSLNDVSVVAIAVLIGYIFPKLIILYAPFALFLGILIQLIWEDKTVTQPL